MDDVSSFGILVLSTVGLGTRDRVTSSTGEEGADTTHETKSCETGVPFTRYSLRCLSDPRVTSGHKDWRLGEDREGYVRRVVRGMQRDE